MVVLGIRFQLIFKILRFFVKNSIFRFSVKTKISDLKFIRAADGVLIDVFKH